MIVILMRSKAYAQCCLCGSHAINRNSCCYTSCRACNLQGVDIGIQYNYTHAWCMAEYDQADDSTCNRG